MSERKRIYDGKRISLELLSLRGRDGAQLWKEIVIYPPSVAILASPAAGFLVFVENYRPALDRWLLEIPAGAIEPGEAPEAAARRELAEETGFRANQTSLVASIFLAPGYSTELLHVFRADAVTAEESGQNLQADEDIKVRVMSHQEIRLAVGRGALQDSKTLAALLLSGFGGACV